MPDNPAPMTGAFPEWLFTGTAARQAGLPIALRRLHQRILTHFLDTGAAPTGDWLDDQATRLDLTAARAFARLAAADLVHLDETGAVSVAYPFSGTPTRHQLQFAGTPPVWAMCAIDALGIPQMAGRDAVIGACDPHSGEEIRVEILNGTWHWHPATTTVLVARTTDRGPSSCCTCPHINFHTRNAHAESYLAARPDLTGRLLDQHGAVDLAHHVFALLLRTGDQ